MISSIPIIYTTNILSKNNLKSSPGIISVNKPVSSCLRICILKSENIRNEKAEYNYQMENTFIWEKRMEKKEITPLIIIIIFLIHSTVNTHDVPSILLSNTRCRP